MLVSFEMCAFERFQFSDAISIWQQRAESE